MLSSFPDVKIFHRWLLALLDYVSRPHEMAICPSSVRVAIISEPYAWISFKFGCCFHWAIRSEVFLNF